MDSSSDSDSSTEFGKNNSNSDSSAPSSPCQKKYRIPKNNTKGRKSKDTISKLREDLPNLNHHSDKIFQSLSWSELFKLDNKLESHGKGGKKLTDKMAKNLEKIKKNLKKVEKGLDNRADIIHDARFLGGHICKNSEIWHKAREKIGIFGLDPISRYDSEGIGMNGNINSHIWAALHNPGSKDFSIRMLSPEALSSARSANEKEAMTCKKDFSSLNDVRLALNTLRTATQLILFLFRLFIVFYIIYVTIYYLNTFTISHDSQHRLLYRWDSSVGPLSTINTSLVAYPMGAG